MFFIHRSVLIYPLYYDHLSVTCIWTWHRISLSHPEGMCVPLSVSELSTVDSQLLCAAVYSLWLSIAFRGSSTRLLPTESNLVHTRSSKGEAQFSLALVYGLYFTAVWEVYCRLCSHSTGLEWVSFPQRWAVMGQEMCFGRETGYFPQPLTNRRNEGKSDVETQKAMVLNYRGLVEMVLIKSWGRCLLDMK